MASRGPVVSPVSWLALALALASAAPGCREDAPTPTPQFAEASSAPAPEDAAVVPPTVETGTVVDAGAIVDAGADAGAVDSGAPDGMLLVPGGAFEMGADTGGEEDEHPAHKVTVASFFLDRTEVTTAAYEACTKAGVCRARDPKAAETMHAGTDAQFSAPDQPVVGVSWDDATKFCAWRGGARLPREAEFERASRDTDGRRFPWGNELPTPDRAVYGHVAGTGTTEGVGTHPNGRGPYGHDDLVGNVWEWCQDEYDPFAYRRSTADRGIPGTCPEILATQNQLRAEGKQGFTGTNPIPDECEHVIRGGAWNYDGPRIRSTNRVHHPGRVRLVVLGFRCAKDAP